MILVNCGTIDCPTLNDDLPDNILYAYTRQINAFTCVGTYCTVDHTGWEYVAVTTPQQCLQVEHGGIKSEL